MNILAVDPGVHTGIAIKLNGSYKTCVVNEPTEVFDLVSGHQWDYVIYEMFSTGGRISSAGLDTVRMIGGIQALCYKLGFEISKQVPQRRMPFLCKASEVLGKDHITNHEKDALAHLLAFEYRMEHGK